MINFSNTEIAFQAKNNKELRNAKFLYNLIKYPRLVGFLGASSQLALKVHFPIDWILKPTLYKLFVGGENIQACLPTAKRLFDYWVYSILDYSVEAAEREEDVEPAFRELLYSVENSGRHEFISHSVFKPTALIVGSVLEKVNFDQDLTEKEQEQYNAYLWRVSQLCETARKAGKPILIDAEDYRFQKAIDETAEIMMEKYNKEKAVVYNTLQMYRHDRLEYFHKILKEAKEKDFILGVKFVRGAYMEKERKLAKGKGYRSPIQETKSNTDDAFNDAMKTALQNIDKVHIFCGTHNESSIRLAMQWMLEFSIVKNDERVFFAQLYGMSDNLSFNLSDAGYNVAKYMPYGKVANVLPYLIRRARENTSIAGQTSRELLLLRKEARRRKFKNEK